MRLTKDALDRMAAVDVRTVDISTLTDLRDIEIDTSLPVEKKLEAFGCYQTQVRPFPHPRSPEAVNRLGDYVVKVRFQEKGASIDDKMSEYLRRLSEIYI